MAERRSLVEGLKTPQGIDPDLAKQFIYGELDAPPKPSKIQNGIPPATEARDAVSQAQVSRVPLTTRIRGDFATALKRASLERQLSGEVPNTMLDILEEALEPWLRTHGYIQ